MRIARTLRHGVVAALAVVAVGAASACEPVVNPPPGGGETVTETLRIGPFNLNPMGQPGSQDEGFQSNVPRPSGDFGMKAISFDLVYEDGTSVPRHDAHLHHVVMMNPARTSMYCDNWPERFAASGQERTPNEIMDPYAYMVDSSDQWNALWHVMNMSDQAMSVYIEYEVAYQPGATAENSRPVTPLFLDVTGCGNSEYDVPGNGGPDSVHENTRTFSAPWDGWVAGFGGHVHGGGINIGLVDESTGFECTMTAEYDSGDVYSHPPDRITRCPVHREFAAGDEYTLVSRYHNDRPTEGAMGIVMAWIWQGDQ